MLLSVHTGIRLFELAAGISSTSCVWLLKTQMRVISPPRYNLNDAQSFTSSERIYAVNFPSGETLPWLASGIGIICSSLVLTFTSNNCIINESGTCLVDAKIILSTSENDSITLKIHNGLNKAVTIAASDPEIGLLGDHVWEFEVKRNIDGSYNYSILRDNISVYTMILLSSFIASPSLLRNWNTIGYHPDVDGFDNPVCFYGNVYLFEMYVDNEMIMKYNFGEGTGNIIRDISGNLRNGAINMGDITRISDTGLILDGEGYGVIPELSSDVRWTNGFKIVIEAKSLDVNRLCTILDLATSYNSGDNNEDKCGIVVGPFLDKEMMSAKTTNQNRKTCTVTTPEIAMSERVNYIVDVVNTGLNYTINIYKDMVLVKSDSASYGCIVNILRKSNLIGKSNNKALNNYRGIIYNMKIITYASSEALPVYKNAIYEFETAFSDFDKPMRIFINTKATNFKYPQHIKKNKNVIIKGSGGYGYTNYVLGLLSDGYLINNPYSYETSIDPITGSVIYTYTNSNSLLEFSEKQSLLGTMRLGYTRLGESIYETKKFSIPGSGKNFEIQISGESSDDLIIESFGFIFKLGKVKER